MTDDAAPDVQLARCHFPVRGLGYGARTGIWLQGCSIRCPGCIVPETWEATASQRVGLAPLLAALQRWVEASDGVTISGGEPFDQPSALLGLLAGLRSLLPGGGDVLVYSGYPWRKLEREHAGILAWCDAVVSEPYRPTEAPARTPLTGSGNQAVHLLTPLARERYRHWRGERPAASVALDGAAIRLAGILTPGAVTRVAREISKAGWEARFPHGAL